MPPLTEQWLPVWATAPQPMDPRILGLYKDGCALQDTTIRQTVRINLATKQIRLNMSNLFGSSPLNISGISVALAYGREGLAAGSPCVTLSTLQTVTCNGSTRIHLPPSGSCTTDPIHVDLARGDHLSISIHVTDGQSGDINGHYIAHTDSWVCRGDVTRRYDVSDGRKMVHWFWMTGVEGVVPQQCGTIYCFGDSITDTMLDTNTYHGWPDGLTRGLDAGNLHLSVLNLGISGDRLLTGGIARFSRDILQPSHGRKGYLMVHIGVNDLGFTPPDAASQGDLYHRLVGTYQQLCKLAHQHDLMIIGTTIMPLLSPPGYATPWPFSDKRRDATRQRVNEWIRTSKHFDKVIDFSAAVTDPENPNHMRATYHNGDYLHPSAEGYRAMTRAIDLALFN